MTPNNTAETPRSAKKARSDASSGSEGDDWVPAPPTSPPPAKRRARPKADQQSSSKPDQQQAPSKPTSSIFRGVTRHVRTDRYEAHVWHKNRQLYLGGFDTEGQAAMAYDMAVLNIKGTSALTNFDKAKYADQLASIVEMKEEELVMMLRNKGKVKPAKASSRYKGVTLHARRRWEARISCGQRRYKYLGLFPTELEAAQAFDRAALAKNVGLPTNFHISSYIHCLSPEQLRDACDRGLLTEQQVHQAQSLQQQSSLPSQAIAPAPPMQPSMYPIKDDAAQDDILEWFGSFDLESLAAEIDTGNTTLPEPPALAKSVFGSGNLHFEDDVVLLDMDMDLPDMGDDVLLQLIEMH